MAPVFSRAAWRCVCHMIQDDRTKNVGAVDAEYIIHYGRPTLGDSDENEKFLAYGSEEEALEHRPQTVGEDDWNYFNYGKKMSGRSDE